MEAHKIESQPIGPRRLQAEIETTGTLRNATRQPLNEYLQNRLEAELKMNDVLTCSWKLS